MQALKHYRSPEILRFLLDEVYRQKKSRRPRQAVAQATFSTIMIERAVDALSILLLQDEDVYVRIFAADSLVKLNRF